MMEIIELKKQILKILFNEKDILNYKYDTYVKEVELLETISHIKMWIIKYRYIFTKYGREDLDKLYSIN